MVDWTEDELEEHWNNLSKDEQLFYGSYSQWKAGIVNEGDDDGVE